MRLFIAPFAFTALLVLGLLHVQSVVVGVWTCGVDPVVHALDVSGHPPVTLGFGEPATACGAERRTPSPTISGWDLLPPLVAPPCTPGATRTWIPGPAPGAHRWIPHMPNAVDVDCERLRQDVGPEPRRDLLLPHRKPSVGTAGTTLGFGVEGPGRS